MPNCTSTRRYLPPHRKSGVAKKFGVNQLPLAKNIREKYLWRSHYKLSPLSPLRVCIENFGVPSVSGNLPPSPSREQSKEKSNNQSYVADTSRGEGGAEKVCCESTPLTSAEKHAGKVCNKFVPSPLTPRPGKRSREIRSRPSHGQL